MQKALSRRKNFISLFIAIIPYFAGLYFEWGTLFSLIILCVYLVFLVVKKRQIIFIRSKDNILLLIIFISALLSTIIGFDRGTSIYGLIKIIIAFLFILILMQDEKINKDATSLLSISGLVMIVLSILITRNPGLRLYMYSDVYGTRRFSSFVQYPNVTSLFFIISFIVFSFEMEEYEKNNNMTVLEKIFMILGMLFLSIGVVWTKSRYGMILFFFVFLYFVISKKRIRKLYLPIMFIGMVFIIIFFVKRSEGNISLNVIAALSTDKSFQTRLFQYSDALKMIAKSPLGHGYGSYFELLPVFQKAMYFVRFVHNGYLSFTFSFGWIAGASLILLVISKIIKSHGMNRVLLIVIVLHFIFDTAIDFMAIALIFISAMDFQQGKKKVFELKKIAYFSIIVSSLIGIMLFFWLGMADIFYYFLKPEIAMKINPTNYEYFENALSDKPLTEDNKKIAERAVKLNKYSDTGLDFLSQYYQENDDFDKAVNYYKRAVLSNKYDASEYLRYKSYLNYKMDFYKKNDDNEKASFCEKEIKWVDDRILEVKLDTYEKAEEFQMTLMI